MRKGFGLEPDIAFGYSMGEISMLYGLGVWESMCNMSHVLNTSSLFKDRLAGQMNAVRESWNLKSNEFHDEQLWNCYSIKLPATEVQAVVDMEPHVYLILINTPRESVIAGEPAACLRIIEILGEKPTPIPVTDVVHCDPVKTEYEEIKRVHTDKVIECPDIDFYSAIDYEISKLDSETLANNIATIYGKTVDYTRLINKVYQDGARIFVDLGPRTTCSKWISETLGDKPNLSISINRKGTDNRLMILQALSSLISHRVSVNLDPLFPDVPKQPEKQLMQTINLGGKNIQQILQKESKE
jgi:Polyketide synthase modules and related proteins